MDNAKKMAGPADSLSNAEKQANKRRTHKVRRQREQQLERIIEHPEDMHSLRFNPYW
jgi:hypothetical protein